MMHHLTLLLLMLLNSCSSHAVKNQNREDSSIPFTFTDHPDYHVHAKKQMLNAGISTDLIEQLDFHYIQNFKKYQELSQKIITLNLFGFLYQGDYMAHHSPLAKKKVKQYLRKHHLTFQATEKKLGVPASVIASLLWVETKFGKVTGRYPLPLVYYSLLLTSHPDVCSQFENEIPRLTEKTDPEQKHFEAVKTKLVSRCEMKSQWAIEELKAIDYLQAKSKMKPFKKNSSFAGAFGLPQFIPSSYVKYAKSRYRRIPDLSRDSDAILSVANFLKTFGWKNNSLDAKKEALFNYNRSRDYGEVILRIASEVKHYLASQNPPKKKDCGPIPPGGSFDANCKVIAVPSPASPN